ncbi:kinesin-like protein [Plakobranchus ocellatus]|uniref:Kinesin-like protein n=1 Tax=Plakobranchus ocellatus TaxID=259542 RepID=A0AAV4CK77_9GAST|nr:kinesin-like protein [Plakobranchus ocellatus]
MGTLYECLREARLEQFYPAFRANGITRSEALINLGMPEFYALGITANEDKRRLMELVNIIKEVHSSGFSASPTPQRRCVGQRQTQNNTSSSDISSHAEENSSDGARGLPHSRGRTRPSGRPLGRQYEGASATDPRLDGARESEARDRAPNFSAASYLDMLQFMSDSSGSDDVGPDNSDEETAHPVAQSAHRNVTASNAVRTSVSRGLGTERVKSKGYNYGVHKVNAPAKTKSSRSSAHRSARDDKIKVCVRKRPLTRREHRAKDEDIVAVESTTTLIVNEPKLAVDLKAYTLQHEFIFDEVFHESCSNEDVYTRAARPLISCIFNGGTATCFAYGQTGAGKTYTMLGDEEIPGLYLLAGRDIFSIINSGQYGRGLHVWISFFEIYCGQLFDLLNRRNRLHAREDGSRQVCIAGLTETEATDVQSLVQTLQYGNSVRSKGATGVNPDSSRSHAILQLDIRNNEDIKVGKISFIDLAGSERASDVTDTDKQTRIEGAEINQSLLALKECIRAIDQDSRHTPFRQSKLTHILKDSFVGNSRTCMIANISPTQTACENTLNTLRYADRVKELKRDSMRSSTVGQAMNLLMNIPPTAPSIFHPSNILSTSTPMRPQPQARRERPSTAASNNDVTLDLSDTPIRGHNMPRRPAVRESSRTHPLERPGDAVSPPLRQPGASTRSSALAASAASQGSVAPPPDASPSESDHTDTDSCNVTHPTYKVGAELAERKNAVAGSMDTEFDFPTSDFNNPEEFNDLNHPQPQNNRPETGNAQCSSEPGPVAASGAETAVPLRATPPDFRRPVLKPVVYRSTDVGSDGAMAADSHRIQPSSEISSTPSQQLRDHERAPILKELFSSDESLNDEDLLADGPPNERPKSTNNLAAPPSVQIFSSSAQHSARTNLTSKRLMMPQPAVSTDLTKFTQRPSLRPPDHDLAKDIPSTGSAKHPYPSSPESRATDTAAYAESSGQKRSAPSRVRDRSPSTKAKSPAMKSPTRSETILPPEAEHTSEINTSPEDRRGSRPHQARQSPSSLEHTPHPPPSPPPGRHPSPPAAEKSRPTATSEIADSATVVKYSSDDASTRTRKYSDVTEHKTHHQRAASSPTGEKSDDSTESIRASLSDQGQGGYRRHRETDRSSMRKERSDPMLALNLQRKKQTLPDAQSISKMLTRSNTPKSGLVHRETIGGSWKVIHDQLPSPKSGTEQTHPAPDPTAVDLAGKCTASGGSQSEPSSLAHDLCGPASGGYPQVPDNIPSHSSDHQEHHLSDESSGHGQVRSTARVRSNRTRRSPSERAQSPQSQYAGSESNSNTPTGKPDGSQLIQLSKPHQFPIQVPVSVSQAEHEPSSGVRQRGGQQAGENVTNASYFRGASSAVSDPSNRNPALVTEKLAPGAMFSPIHPYPVTVAGTRLVAEPATSSSVLLQPTPVPVSSTSSFASGHSGQEEYSEALQRARSELISAHEDQLANITSLCKHEMRLLLNAKKAPGKRGFDDYLRRVNDILQQKMIAIASLQSQIGFYRSNYPASSTSRSVTSSVSSSVADGGSAVGASTNRLQ